MSISSYRHAAAWSAVAAAIVCAAPAVAQPAGQADYALPAQELSRSLRQVSIRSATNIIAPSELVGGRRAPPLRGRFSPREAVERLLAGSGLGVSEVGGALVITRAGQQASGPPGTAESAESETVVVTGSNLRGAEPTSPLVRITRDDIDRTGATSAEQLLRRVPQNSQGGVNQENAGIVTPDTDVTNHGAGLNLRGLGQRATLVLVNGRRLAPSGSGSFVDISLIPLSAVERVDILPDGASAIYGSDAVGGVVNFILRGGSARPESALLVGTTSEGGGTQVQASQSLGGHWGSGNALIAYEYRREDEVRASQRDGVIGLQPGTFLLPRETRHSLLGTLEQEVGGALRVGLTASYAHRSTARTAFLAAGILPTDVDAEAAAIGLAGQLALDLPGGWLARLDGNYSLSDTDQIQIQQDTNRLMNSRGVRNEILEGSLRLDGALFDFPGGPVRLALGANLRREDYRDTFESASIARVTKSASRDVRSAFGELALPIFSNLNRRPGFERLLLSAAARYDHYEGTGSTFDPKLGLLWTPLPGLDLRGSYGTSFRAPLLSETTGLYNAIYFPAALLDAVPGQAPPGRIGLVLQGSDPEIRPETSRTWSFGAEFSPRIAPGLSLSFNYYSIRFSNRIAIPVSALNVVGNPAFASVVTISPSSADVTALVQGAQLVLDGVGGGSPTAVGVILDTRATNTAVTSTRGFDVALRYRFGWRGSRFTLDGQVTHIIAFDDQLTAASPVVNSLDRPFRPLAWRGRGGVASSRGGWAGSLFVNYSDDYLDDRRPVAVRVGSYTTLEANFAYEFGENGPGWLRGTRISLFADNLLNEKPPPLAPAVGALTGIGYDPVNATIRGRFIALQVRRTW
jgi:outer membrane receptor protein involved in Fe transport